MPGARVRPGRPAGVMAKVTQRQIKLLAPYLEGDHPTHNNVDERTGDVTREWNLLCPLHEVKGSTRSASLNIDKGLFYCFVCGGMPVTALIRRKDEWNEPGAKRNGTPSANGHAPERAKRVLTEALVDGWHSALVSNEGALLWLRERRGITLQTVQRYKIGYRDERLYTIPVWSPEGQIWNIRYYDPNPTDQKRKIWSESGYGAPRLYPYSVIEGDPREIIICEGEWDCLKLLQHGYTAITRTGTADTWEASWSELFADKRVYLCHDCDDKGQKANRQLARSLGKIADVRIVELPYPIVEKHGQDVTNFFMDYPPAEFQQLLDEAQPLYKKDRKPDPGLVTVLDTFDARNVGDPVRVVVTIKGRKEPGYTIPRRVKLACTMDAGNKCEICPLRAARGEATVEIEPDDAMVLEMIDAPNTALQQVVAGAYGVPGGKCIKLVQEVDEHQAVEVLFARPALDFSDGSETDPDKAAIYKNLTITSVGRHDTLANNTIIATGALQPNPRSQRNEFLVHEIERVETSVDKFELNDKTVKLMRRFQTEGPPLKKLAEISKAMSAHVTRIHGRPEMHALIDLVFHSVLSFKFAGELISRGWLEALIVGDTRTGKSLAAQRLVQHFGAGEVIGLEAATFAGVVGGVQQMNGKDWAVTWGVVPINDRRLVVLDEISGLTTEEIAQMSDIRSSGQAKLIKVVQEAAWARTRLLWLGNPRNATMANYTYGVDAVKPLIGNAEDIARFDLAMAVTLFDVASEVINQPALRGELRYTQEACHSLLMWVWTRSADQIVFTAKAEAAVFDAANELGKLYIEDPPLIQAANVRVKIARTAAALAARLFSTDSKCERVIVKPQHVTDAVAFINKLYGMQAFGYRERSREVLADRYEAEQNKGRIREYLKGRPLLAKHLRSAGKFRRQDLEELLNCGKEEANGIINTLFEARMVKRVLGDIYVEPTLHSLLRETSWR